jgi:formylglycine-generating enzyme required for sulfatase activity
VGVQDDGAKVGDALLVAGYDTAAINADDPRLPLVTQLGEALLASASPWRIRRLAAHGSDRDVPSRGNVRRDLDALLHRPAAARILVIAAGLTRTVEGLAVVCAPTLGGFREDASVPLEWFALRLRRAADVPTALVVAMPGVPRDAGACLDVLGTAATEHVIVVDAGEPVSTLRGLIDGLWSEAIDLATGTVTPRSLGDYLGRRLGKAAIQPSSSMRTLLAPRGLARADLAERTSQRPHDEADELIGAVLPGRFRVVSELGRGSFGVVYRAHQELVDRPVAIKVLPARLGVDAIRRFALEIRAVGGLDHRNVVRVLHADVMRDGRMFVAMELLSGPTLEQLLVDGPLSPTRAFGLARQLIAGLAAAHAAGIIHADVKPANAIVVDGSDPRLVLLDFGLSRLRADDAAAALGGTPAFMAPEQLRGGRVDASVDLYAAALVSLTLIAGTPPRTEADRARALAAFVDDRVRAALVRALAEDPAARFASAVEMAAALGDVPSGAITRPARPPFRLAAPFSEEDRGDFHGRTPDVERLLEHVLFRRAVVYVAPSGTGKTSLLRAGLVPRLRDLDIDVAYVACRAGVANDIAGTITSGASTVPDAIERRLTAPSTRRLVLIIDQIEAALVGGRDDTHGEAVLEALALPAWPVDAPVAVVWSVREEYLARLLDRVQRLEPGVPIVRLGPLAPEVAADIFTRTLEHRAVTVEPALVEVLVRDLTGAAAGLAIELGWGDGPAVYPPHLQLAGAVLYEARADGAIDLELYRRLGGLATILAEHLHHVLEGELGATDTAIARDVLLALVTSSHTRAACEQPELVARVVRLDAARSESAVTAVLQFLRDRGLLVAVAGPRGEPVWDLAHDSLVAQVEAWVTATDLARRRALELVRYHLRRSTPKAPSRLGVAELREVRDHLGARDLTDLDDEWRARPEAGTDPASRLLATSRRAVMRRRAALGGFALAAIAIAGGFALRWRDGLQEISLRDRDIGSSQLVLRAFDWDPATLTAIDVGSADFSWELVRPAPGDDDMPGQPFAPGDLSRRPVTPPPGAVRADAVDARGGPAVLMITRRDRGGRACSSVIVPIRHLPGYSQTHNFSLRIPTCEATLAGMILVPAGTFIAGGIGEPPSPDQQHFKEDFERESWLSSYWLDRTEVPNAALAAVSAALEAGGRTLPTYPDSDELARAGEPDRPAMSLTWFDAKVVCRLLGKRLPTSDEWQKAARGSVVLGESLSPNPYPRRNLPWGPSSEIALPWGPSIEIARANVNYGGATAPAPVGSFPGDVGPYGHVDMAGNVTEWTADRKANGFVCTRGGNWSDTTASKLIDLVALKNQRAPQLSWFTMGFRCAADADNHSR